MIQLKTEKDSPLSILRHSMAHVMAQAVFKLFPGSKIAIGPAIDTGFYYDFELSRPITQDDLAEIEKEMRRIVSGNHDFERKVVSREEALSLFADQPYKIELINEIIRDERGASLRRYKEIFSLLLEYAISDNKDVIDIQYFDSIKDEIICC